MTAVLGAHDGCLGAREACSPMAPPEEDHMASSGTPQKPTEIDLPPPQRREPNRAPSSKDLARFVKGSVTPARPALGNKHQIDYK